MPLASVMKNKDQNEGIYILGFTSNFLQEYKYTVIWFPDK